MQPHIRQIWHDMRYNFISRVLHNSKTMLDSLNRMPPIGIPGHILINTLDSNLNPSAAVAQHVRNMRRLAVIWPSFYCDCDAFALGLLGKLYGLLVAMAAMERQPIMEIPNEVVPIILRQGHESTPH
jgi:hypothetical protein